MIKKHMRKHHEIGGNISATGLYKGESGAVRKMAGGGHNELFLKAKKRNEILGQTPEMKRGGRAHSKGLVGMFKELHGKFESKPYMKALGATKENVYEGEPHRATKAEMRKGCTKKLSKGGALWIQGAIKHKGALHKSLGVPSGKKIPLTKIKKAEHSSSPVLRKRAHLAETLRKFHR
jgi:hypothetical protein